MFKHASLISNANLTIKITSSQQTRKSYNRHKLAMRQYLFKDQFYPMYYFFINRTMNNKEERVKKKGGYDSVSSRVEKLNKTKEKVI